MPRRIFYGVVLIALALAVGSSGTGAASASTASCYAQMNVLFFVASGSSSGGVFPRPSDVPAPNAPNGCWSYSVVGQPNYAPTFTLCGPSQSVWAIGTGPNVVYNDTDPYVRSPSADTGDIDGCVGQYSPNHSLYAEFMAPRNSPTYHYCSNASLQAPCWERNNGGSLVTAVGHYYAELFQSTGFSTDVYSMLDTWNQGGHGANPSNSAPMMNFTPDDGNQTNMMQHVIHLCSVVLSYGDHFMGLYATKAGGLNPNDELYINQALNACTGQ